MAKHPLMGNVCLHLQQACYFELILLNNVTNIIILIHGFWMKDVASHPNVAMSITVITPCFFESQQPIFHDPGYASHCFLLSLSWMSL